MFVLLQVYPPEATAEDGSDDCCCLDVITVNASEAELERFLAGYQFRYAAGVPGLRRLGRYVGRLGSSA